MQMGRVDKKRYAEDKPKDCAYCYFWNEKEYRCMEPKCYYLLDKTGGCSEGIPIKGADCKECPYGRHSPCLGYCLQKILLEMEQKKQSKQKEGGGCAG